jgi:hypothetical protein
VVFISITSLVAVLVGGFLFLRQSVPNTVVVDGGKMSYIRRVDTPESRENKE